VQKTPYTTALVVTLALTSCVLVITSAGCSRAVTAGCGAGALTGLAVGGAALVIESSGDGGGYSEFGYTEDRVDEGAVLLGAAIYGIAAGCVGGAVAHAVDTAGGDQPTTPDQSRTESVADGWPPAGAVPLPLKGAQTAVAARDGRYVLYVRRRSIGAARWRYCNRLALRSEAREWSASSIEREGKEASQVVTETVRGEFSREALEGAAQAAQLSVSACRDYYRGTPGTAAALRAFVARPTGAERAEPQSTQ
jgi:hypothetical protein